MRVGESDIGSTVSGGRGAAGQTLSCAVETVLHVEVATKRAIGLLYNIEIYTSIMTACPQ